METAGTGFESKKHTIPTKRYCQTLTLKENPELIEEYIKRHSKELYWPVVGEGIKSVGILEMDIYIKGNRLFMIVEAPLDFNWQEAFSKLPGLPMQEEWEEHMSEFQEVEKGLPSGEKWELMERIFHLYDY